MVVSIKDDTRTSAVVYSLSNELHDTKANPDVLKASLASDFITYRVLSSFYLFRNSQAIDLWPVFEQEILPFALASEHLAGGQRERLASHAEARLKAWPLE